MHLPLVRKTHTYKINAFFKDILWSIIVVTLSISHVCQWVVEYSTIACIVSGPHAHLVLNRYLINVQWPPQVSGPLVTHPSLAICGSLFSNCVVNYHRGIWVTKINVKHIISYDELCERMKCEKSKVVPTYIPAVYRMKRSTTI